MKNTKSIGMNPGASSGLRNGERTGELTFPSSPLKEEYLEMRVKNNIDFKEEYLFEFFSDIHNWD